MVITWLQTLLTTPFSNQRRRSYLFWLGLSLAVALGYAMLALEEPLSQPYVVQDDARQFLFWMQRSLNPSLFPNDLIADYFQSVTPLGYKALYGGAIALGIKPFTLNIFLPAVIALISTQYLFRLTFAILPIPFTAWMASVLFNQTVWMKDDLVSATPRAFVYPLFLAFLFYWVQFDRAHQMQDHQRQDHQKWRSLLSCTVSLGLLGLFYPQYVLLAGAMLGIAMLADGTLVGWLRAGRIPLNQWPSRFYWVTIITILGVIGFYATTSSAYGPVVTLAQAKTMPEFWPGGRNFFFSDNLWWFYGVGDRSGFLHVGLVRPATLSLGIFLPLMLRFPKGFPLINAFTPSIYRLGHLLLAATGLFLFAHLLLFRLHLPGRYTDHSLRIIMAIAAALVLTLALDAVFNTCRRFCPDSNPSASVSTVQISAVTPLRTSFIKALPKRLPAIIAALACTLFLFSLLLAYPQFVDPFPLTKYKTGRFPDLYAYLRRQPPDTLVASIAKEADNIPIFAQRPILIGHEYAIPYHTGYYREFRQRAIALLNAQYTTDQQRLAAFIDTYGVDLFLLENNAYRDDYLQNHWVQQYLSELSIDSQKATLLDLRQAGLGGTKIPPARRPILQRKQGDCTVLREGNLRLIDAQCLLN